MVKPFYLGKALLKPFDCDKRRSGKMATLRENRTILAVNGWKAHGYSFIFARMRASAQPVLAILLALALVVGGAGRFALGCGEEPITSHSHAENSHAGHHHSHDNDAAKKPFSAPECFKCCGICLANPGLSRVPRVVVELTSHPVVFSLATQAYSDHLIVIDPGIPKPTA